MITHPDYETLKDGSLKRINAPHIAYDQTYWGMEGRSTIQDQLYNCDGFRNEAGLTKAQAILQHCVGKSILEIGCSPGAFMRLASGRGFECTGIDPCEEHATFVRAYTACKVVTTMFEDFESETKYDTIVAADILEHSHHPKGFVAKCQTHLKPDGRMIFMLPALYDDGLFRESDFIPEHVHLFSQKHLRKWLKPVIFDRWSLGHEIIVVENGAK